MPLKFPVSPGTILLCDYSAGGFREPEMIKLRPAIVMSPRLAHRDHLCTVIPLSGTEPPRAVSYVIKLQLTRALPSPFEQDVWWAKGDMLATVGFGRLDQFRTGRDDRGKRQYIQPKVSEHDFVRLQGGILHALGLGELGNSLTQSSDAPN